MYTRTVQNSQTNTNNNMQMFSGIYNQQIFSAILSGTD